MAPRARIANTLRQALERRLQRPDGVVSSARVTMPHRVRKLHRIRCRDVFGARGPSAGYGNRVPWAVSIEHPRPGRTIDRLLHHLYLSIRAGRPVTVASISGRPEPEPEGSVLAWIYLVIAGFLEIVWAFFMKKSMGFTLLVPSAITIVTMVASFALLSIAMRSLPLGTAYTVWTGIGAVGAFAVGVVVLGESVTPMRLLAALLIIAGIALMKVSSPAA